MTLLLINRQSAPMVIAPLVAMNVPLVIVAGPTLISIFPGIRQNRPAVFKIICQDKDALVGDHAVIDKSLDRRRAAAGRELTRQVTREVRFDSWW